MNPLQNDNLKLLLSRHQAAFDVCEKKLAQYLTEGVLLDKYIVDNVADLLHCLRQCNVAIRWTMLHRRSSHKKFSYVEVLGVLWRLLHSLTMPLCTALCPDNTEPSRCCPRTEPCSFC